MTKVNCYLAFEGTCEAAFTFYKTVFEKEFSSISYYRDMPSEEPFEEKYLNYVMHVELPVSNETMLLGCDTIHGYVAGNNVSIAISTECEDEARRIFEKLSDGGNVTMPFDKTFWGSMFGMVTDRFGIYWLVDCPLPKPEN